MQTARSGLHQPLCCTEVYAIVAFFTLACCVRYVSCRRAVPGKDCINNNNISFYLVPIACIWARLHVYSTADC